MASFQVDMVPTSPFFKNNLSNLDLTDLWVHHPQWQTDDKCNNGDDSYGAYVSAPSPSPAPNINNKSSSPPKDKWARAREIVFPSSNINTNNTPKPHAASDINPNINAGGVSSLVQKWRGFEAVANRGAPTPPPLPPGPLPNPNPMDDDSLIGDWESDRTILSGRSSIRGGRDSDATESERLRVADIIRKLTPNEAASGSISISISPPRISSRTSLDQCIGLPPMAISGSRVRTSLDHPLLPPTSTSTTSTSTSRARTSFDQSDLSLRCVAPSPSPRIRGRQAYIDLLAQRERDRRMELQLLLQRNPVSKFSHRGRIQAALKIKLLRRRMEAKDDDVIPFHSHKPLHSRPNSNSLRKEEKYEAKSCLRAQDPQDCIATSKHVDFQHNANFLMTTTTTTKTFLSQNTSPKSAETIEAPKNLIYHRNKDDDDVATTNYHLIQEMDSNNKQRVVETATYWVADFSQTNEDGWQELQSDYQTNEANDIDWIEQVSRPRSDWEYLRQERYQEMLDPFLDNEEIRVLLGRKSVSSFLLSGMREKIDQLMISRSQEQQNLNNNNNNSNSDSNYYNERQDKMGEVAELEGREEEEYGEYNDEYDEAESSTGQQFTECDEFVDPSTPHSQNQNNNHNHHHHHQGGREPSECSYQAASPSTQQSSTNYCSQDMTGRNSSFNARPTFEMEIIYDLKRHMEQLHQEISELRKSIKCCTDMQIKLHRSIQKEVTAAITHPDAKNGRRQAVKKGTSGRRCCVCCTVQVDCLLYRCGHMCTCFDCANELHWSSGRCPICRAQILDVVRAQFSN